MDRVPLDEICDTFVTFDTMTPNPNRNRFLTKFQTENRKSGMIKTKLFFDWLINIDIGHTSLFFTFLYV